MPFNLNGYDQFITKISGIENPLAVEVHVDPALNGGANLLCMFSGTVVIEGFIGLDQGPLKQSSEWSRGWLEFDVPTPGRVWTFIPDGGVPASSKYTYFHTGTVTTSLAAIYNRKVANNAGWAVDAADVYGQGYQDIGLHVIAKVAIRDSDGYLHRVSYQVTALGQTTGGGVMPPREPPSRSPRG